MKNLKTLFKTGVHSRKVSGNGHDFFRLSCGRFGAAELVPAKKLPLNRLKDLGQFKYHGLDTVVVCKYFLISSYSKYQIFVESHEFER